MPDDQTQAPKPKLDKQQSQCMALAALVQAAELVRQLAFNGSANEYQVRPLLHSLFAFEADNSIDIYADLRLLEQGFNRLYKMLGGDLNDADKDIIKYAVTLINLGDILQRRQKTSDEVFQRLSKLNYPGEQPWLDLPHNIDAIYKDTISKLGQRIQVAGDANHLQNELTAARIRTLLLCGIRAAVLWRQVGGPKWSLFFSRKQYQKTIAKLSPVNR